MSKKIKAIDFKTHTILMFSVHDGRDHDIKLYIVPTDWYLEASKRFFPQDEEENVPTDVVNDTDEDHKSYDSDHDDDSDDDDFDPDDEDEVVRAFYKHVKKQKFPELPYDPFYIN